MTQLPTNKGETIYFSKNNDRTIRLRKGKCSNFVFLIFLLFTIFDCSQMNIFEHPTPL